MSLQESVDHIKSSLALKTKAGDIHRHQRRLLVGIAGIPGSGKSTLAQKIVSTLNPGIKSINVPMDGFHYPRSYLDMQPDASEWYRRRGSPWTFDALKLNECLRELKSTSSSSKNVVLCPSFDHKIKDPIEHDIQVGADVEIVIVEGNYLLYDDKNGIWSDCARLFDLILFLDCPLDVARDRLIARHLKSGICGTREQAAMRTDENDLVNAKDILTHRLLDLPLVRVINQDIRN
jgi:pantothenate kinase